MEYPEKFIKQEKLMTIIFSIIFGTFGFFMGLVVVMAIVDFNEVGFEPFLMMLFLFVLPVFVLYLVIRRAKKVSSFIKYYYILQRDPQRSLTKVANELNIPMDVVVANIESMIRMRLFTDVVLDEGNTRLVELANMNNIQPENDYIAVQCEHCGAKNKVQKGKYADCEYCNSPLETK